MSSRRRETISRRAASVAAVSITAVVLTLVLVPLLVVLALVDLVRLKPRLPLARLVTFAWCWSWLEVAGLKSAAVLWLTGRGRDREAHYRLQRWWAGRLMASLRATCGISVEVNGVDVLGPGPTVLLVRHASLADSLLTAWVVAEHAELHPRVVLKHELLADPCLDVVGNRLPNCFVDRGAEDSTPALEEIESLGSTMSTGDVSVIFPEGTRSNPTKQRRALERIAERDPDRAERLAALDHLLPPRPSGTRALLRGGQAVGARVVVGWHTGFDGLDSFSGILSALGRGPDPVRLSFASVDDVPDADDPGLTDWLDDQWLGLDRRVSEQS